VTRSITIWYRIEPRDDQPEPGPDRALQARLFDPGWLLGRQWQLGELTGEDAGSPAWVRLRMARTPIDRLQLGDGPVRELSTDDLLEPQVEAEVRPAEPGSGEAWAAAVDAGRHLLTALGRAGLGALVPAFRSAFPLPDPDPAGRDRAAARRFRVLRRSTVDGLAALNATRGPDGVVRLPELPPVQPPLTDAQRAAAVRVLRRWVDWYPPAPPGTGSGWVTERLEYRFRVGAAYPDGDGELVLQAPAYQGGRLDWHDLRAGEGPLGEARADVPPDRWVHAGLPARVGYPGMPANRWWEFEDGGVSFAHVEAEGGDLARLLLVEFASVYGNDWFLAPCDAPFGTVLAVQALVVTDTFGGATLVSPARLPGWAMYQVSGAPPGHLVLPSVTAGSLAGAPIEEVQLSRDEMADLGWAIERTVPGAAGQRLDRHEQWRDRLAGRPAAVRPAGVPTEAMVYTLADEPPDHWTPLVPQSDGPRSIRLRRGAFLRGDGEAFPPLGRFLDRRQRFELFEEELPRSGMMLTRCWQLARTADGRSLAWIGRRARPGRGESRSQVGFDRLRPADGEPTG
jgi:hypothetical protein